MSNKKEVMAKEEEAIEALDPKYEVRKIVIGEGEDQLVFYQKPLSFFGKIEFFSVAGKAVEKVLSDGGSLDDLIGNFDPENPLQDDSNSTDRFLVGIAKIVQYAPEILGELYCVILAIPKPERDYVQFRLENELDDEQGLGILQTFVEQNWEVMINFFNQGVLPIFQQIQKKI